MHINTIDLNLLRLFDAVHAQGSVSRAAEQLGMTQPAASQGLTRLRLLLEDALFTRASGGVRPTPRAERLAPAVRAALAALQQALEEPPHFDPARSHKVFRIHMSDIGEGRFLPPLMARLREQAPGVRLETLPLRSADIAGALDEGRIDFAFGFLPKVKDNTRQTRLLNDRYVVVLRADHPFAQRPPDGEALLAALKTLDYVAVRSHADTLRILQLLHLEERVRLVTEHFMVLPAIVRETDLAVVMPRNIARGFIAGPPQDETRPPRGAATPRSGERGGQFLSPGGFAIVEPDLPLRDFSVALHWSWRFEADPAHQWLRQVIVDLFREENR
jgi:DNA-binding transcriptional LysR family regulator